MIRPEAYALTREYTLTHNKHTHTHIHTDHSPACGALKLTGASDPLKWTKLRKSSALGALSSSPLQHCVCRDAAATSVNKEVRQRQVFPCYGGELP